VLLTRPLSGHAAVSLVGVGAAVGTAAMWVMYIALAGRLGAHLDGLHTASFVLLIAAFIVFPIAILHAGTELLQPQVVGLGLALALLAAAIGQGMEIQVLATMPPRVYGVLVSIEPVVAAVFGVVLLGESLVAGQWVGVIAIVAACAGAVAT
jgi:inner membrane transporter RhtA